MSRLPALKLQLGFTRATLYAWPDGQLSQDVATDAVVVLNQFFGGAFLGRSRLSTVTSRFEIGMPGARPLAQSHATSCDKSAIFEAYSASRVTGQRVTAAKTRLVSRWLDEYGERIW